MCLVTDRQRAGGADATGGARRVGGACRGAPRAGARARSRGPRAHRAGGAAAWPRCAARAPASSSTTGSTWRWPPAPTACTCGPIRWRPRGSGRWRRPGSSSAARCTRCDEAVEADAAGGLDYLLFGTVFATASKPGRAPAGTSALAAVVAAVRVPVLAVGGVTPDNLRGGGGRRRVGLRRHRHVRGGLRNRPRPGRGARRGRMDHTQNRLNGTQPPARHLQTRRSQPRTASARGAGRRRATRRGTARAARHAVRRRRSRDCRDRRADARVDSSGDLAAALAGTVSADTKARFAAKGIHPAGDAAAGRRAARGRQPRGRGGAARRRAAVRAPADFEPERRQAHRPGDEGHPRGARDPDPRSEPHRHGRRAQQPEDERHRGGGHRQDAERLGRRPADDRQQPRVAEELLGRPRGGEEPEDAGRACR